jgi:AraC family transcriptional regulator
MTEQAGIPVTQGAGRSWHVNTGDFSVSELFFDGGVRLAPHHHDPACISLLATGTMEKGFGGRTYQLPSSSMITIPPGETHTDHFGHEGSRIVVIQVDTDIVKRHPIMEPSIKLLDDILEQRSRRIGSFARRLSQELRAPDNLSGLAVSGLVFELISTLGRDGQRTTAQRAQPAWLSKVLEYLHAHDDRMVRIEDVAVEVDLHPGYLARAFREHIGMPIGAYAREIRLERAAADLSTTDDRILDIAIAAGFTDQSHLTRLFRRRFGVTPAQYRTTVR